MCVTGGHGYEEGGMLVGGRSLLSLTEQPVHPWQAPHLTKRFSPFGPDKKDHANHCSGAGCTR